MLLLAAVCWGIWVVRNKITFEKTVVCSPMITFVSICSFLQYWAGLYGAEDGELIKNGARQLLLQAACLHSGAPTTDAETSRTEVMMITNGGV